MSMVTITAGSAESTSYIWNFSGLPLRPLHFLSAFPSSRLTFCRRPSCCFTLFIPCLIDYHREIYLLLSQMTSSNIDICILPLGSEKFAGPTIEACAWYTAEQLKPFRNSQSLRKSRKGTRNYLKMDSPWQLSCEPWLSPRVIFASLLSCQTSDCPRTGSLKPRHVGMFRLNSEPFGESRCRELFREFLAPGLSGWKAGFSW